MNGDRQLLAMRKAHRTPRCVWITDSDDDYSRETARDWHIHRNSTDGQFHAHLRIEAGDIPEALDLRCVSGMECHNSSDRGHARFDRIFHACLAAGASVVVGLSNNNVRFERATQETPNG